MMKTWKKCSSFAINHYLCVLKLERSYFNNPLVLGCYVKY